MEMDEGGLDSNDQMITMEKYGLNFHLIVDRNLYESENLSKRELNLGPLGEE